MTQAAARRLANMVATSGVIVVLVAIVAAQGDKRAWHQGISTVVAALVAAGAEQAGMRKEVAP